MSPTESVPTLEDVLRNVEELLFVVRRLDDPALTRDADTLREINEKLSAVRGVLTDVIISRGS